MTQNTEQERATREDFEHWATSTNQGYDLTRNQSGRMQTYECVKTEHAWRGFFHGWQAARRAQVVPHTKVKADFYWVPEKQHHVPTLLIEFEPVPAGEPCDAKGWTDRDNLAAMLATAPLPPEATVKESLTVEAAPVRLPEARIFWIEATTQFCIKRGGEVPFASAWEPLYTEHQVRQLLAANGVK